MHTLTLEPVTTPEQIETVAGLAGKIWREHYAAILESGQIDYMLEQFQSAAAVADQLREGYRYYLFCIGGAAVGYLSIKPEEKRLFLSKLYVARDYRRRGVAGQALARLEDLCRREGYDSIYLTVNKHNVSSIAAYNHMGFVKVLEQTVDIGQGYVMDDFVMERQVAR